MTRAEILALEGDALWEAALQVVEPGEENRRGNAYLMKCGELSFADAAFAILRAVRGWDTIPRSRFNRILNELTDGLYIRLEPHHIARAALLARSEA